MLGRVGHHLTRLADSFRTSPLSGMHTILCPKYGHSVGVDRCYAITSSLRAPRTGSPRQARTHHPGICEEAMRTAETSAAGRGACKPRSPGKQRIGKRCRTGRACQLARHRPAGQEARYLAQQAATAASYPPRLLSATAPTRARTVNGRPRRAGPPRWLPGAAQAHRPLPRLASPGSGTCA